jgi:dihydroorotate dehydrogenase
VYGLLFRLVLARLPAETSHRLSVRLLRAFTFLPGATSLLRRLLSPRDPALRVRVLGLDLPSPLGLAAGFDSNAKVCDAIGALGFGFVEVGGVTTQPQSGNPQPRLFRLLRDRALINRMGFPNQGSAAAAVRLRRRRGRALVVGAQIARSKATADAEAVSDYVTSAKRLAGVVDFLVVNVSSPNTPGLRDLQAVDRLRPLLSAVRQTLAGASPSHVPLLVKIAPDLADADVDAIADLALELEIDGIVATNTTVSREGLISDSEAIAAAGKGGLSGAPLKQRSIEVLRRLRARVGSRLVLVSVGGIETPEDAWERIRAGATLIQAYTGFVYGGPLWPRRINQGLSTRLREAGLASITESISG